MIQNSPDGKLLFRRYGNKVYYFCRTDAGDTTGKYIKTNEHAFAAALAQKDYDEKVLKLAQEELHHIQPLLKQYEKGQIETVYDKLQMPRQKLIQPIVIPDEQFVRDWQSVSYEKKGFSDHAPEYFTAKGERVRSKSEIIIADTLRRNGIPYRYEFPLKLKGSGIIHPDFTVLNIRLRKVFLWEHFGMMDASEYSEKALERITNYEKNGYYPGSHLIITYETSSHPLRTKLIEELISHYLV